MARRTLSQEVKNGILSDLALDVSPATIAGKFGVSIPTVYNFRKRAAAAQTTAAPVVTEANGGATTTAGFAVAAATRKTSKRSVR